MQKFWVMWLVAVGLAVLGCATAAVGTSGDTQRLQDACDSGVPNACFDLGLQFGRGQGVEQDFGRASELYERACELGVAAGCTNLGFYYEIGRFVGQDHERAAALYLQGCEMGNALGCTNLGLAYENGRGVARDHKAAAGFYQMGCKGDDATGCVRMGQYYQRGADGTVDHGRAVDWYERACHLGSAQGCTSLGWYTETGRGGRTKNQELAYSLYRQGCLGDYGIGCGNLGLAAEYGRGTEVNLEQAAWAYERACELEWTRGCHRLGLLTLSGRGVSQDQPRAVELFRAACDAGHGEACTFLGNFFQNGQYVPEDRAQALLYLTKGCEAKDAPGCEAAGVLKGGLEGAEFQVKACEHSPDTCVAGVRKMLSQGDAEVVPAAIRALDLACEANAYSACMARVALRHPSMKEDFETRCKAGDGSACLHLSRLLAADSQFDDVCLLEKRKVVSETDTDRGCEGGGWEACWLRGTRLLTAKHSAMVGGMLGGLGLAGSSGNEAERRARLQRECDGGDLGSCVDLGFLLRRLDEPEEARRVFQSACDKGEPRGCREIAMELVGSEDTRELNRGIEMLSKLCDEEYFRGCLDQAQAIQKRDGDRASHKVVAGLKQRACRGGNSQACWRLRMYFENRSESVHDQACAYHYSHHQCRLDNWSECGRFKQ